MSTPITNGRNGRGTNGQFLPGNPGGPGSPHVKKVAALRAAMFKAVHVADLRAVIRKLVELAKAGDVQAAKVVLERLLGPAVPIDYEERLAELEQHLAQANERS